MIQAAAHRAVERAGRVTSFDEFHPSLKHSKAGSSPCQCGPGNEWQPIFIHRGGTPWLDNRHTILASRGRQDVPQDRICRATSDRPKTPVSITKLRIERRRVGGPMAMAHARAAAAIHDRIDLRLARRLLVWLGLAGPVQVEPSTARRAWLSLE